MSYLSLLTEDEALYICSVIPYKEAVLYFKNYPKKFAKIRPGFRATTLSKADVIKLLFKYRNRYFVSSFIEKKIRNWVFQIQEHIEKCMEDGDSKDKALVHTLPFCFFADNVGLYFKLVNEEYPEEYIVLMSETSKVIKDVTDKQDDLKEEIKETKFECKKLLNKLDAKDAELNRNKVRLSERSLEIDALNDKVYSLEKLQSTFEKDKEKIKTLRREKRELLGKINMLSTEITELENNSQLLEKQIRSKLEEQQKCVKESQIKPNPKCPCDIVEFKEYLGYNLSNIGMIDNTEYFLLIISYLSKNLFHGVPIVVNHATGINLIKCIANTLIGKQTVKTMTYDQNVTSEKVKVFLSSSDRIVCLDNFIGNYNETILISLMERHKDKIIFLTIMYDRTLRYVSKEFLRYCHYLNTNHIAALTVNTELTEDPSTIVEHSCVPLFAQGKNRFRNILREILRELSYPQSLIEYKCKFIANEQDLCESLVFDILPYCTDVLQIKPYNTSEQLIKYASNEGRCPQKKLLLRWFS